jgi:formylglycine-generating enzyme required for sulfatase activity
MRIDPADLAGAGRGRRDNALGMPLRWCPPGAFHLGRLPGGLERFEAIAPRPATIDRGFWIGEREVTQSEWLRLMGATLREQRAKDPSQPRPLGDGSTREHAGEGPDRPIYFVSHAEAEAFCRELTEAERAGGRLEAGWEYRLPTEAQWEYACRAGTTTATAFGDALSGAQANFDGTRPLRGAEAGPYLREITPAGRYPANAWGIFDMHGNLWEWCLDDVEAADRAAGPKADDADARRRIYRGGCWHNFGSMALSTSRGWGDAGDRGSGVGFRVALVFAGP